MKDIPIYETVSTIADGYPTLTYAFESQGTTSVTKIIQYSPFESHGQILYNLGFGDYDSDTGGIIDSINSNNKDMYTVFNTVLHSVLDFFSNRPEDKIYVTGSDNEDLQSFVETCKQKCTKNCSDNCKNINRRIKTYCRYVNRDYDNLTVEYDFYGQKWGESEFTPFIRHENYKALIVNKKRVSIFAQ